MFRSKKNQLRLKRRIVMDKSSFQVVAKWDRCTGCRLCELACTKFHFGIINPELSRIRIYTVHPGPMNIPMLCSHCSDTPCVNACPTGALHTDEGSYVIKVDVKKCLGSKCGLCARACREERSGVVKFFPPHHDYPLICDKCDGDPQCVSVCPFGTIEKVIHQIVDGRWFADPLERIAEDLAQRWLPATKERVKLPSMEK